MQDSPLPERYQFLEEEALVFTIRLKANALLKQHIKHLLIRPEVDLNGKPDVRHHDFKYQAASWKIPRRVVAKGTGFAGQLFPAVGFIVTNLNWAPRRVTHFYNQRGTAGQWIKEGKYALNWTHRPGYRNTVTGSTASISRSNTVREDQSCTANSFAVEVT